MLYEKNNILISYRALEVVVNGNKITAYFIINKFIFTCEQIGESGLL
jgi:hypothetical protein